MSGDNDGFIELNRTLFELPRDYTQGAERDDLELSEALGLRINKDLGWDALLKQYRVVLLAEAGSGKTEEIHQTARKLRSEGKIAFFIRLEHISSGLEGAFEEGDYEEFQHWLGSNDEGWLLLDSVDEARLKHTQDFEQAIRKIACDLRPAFQRVHIIITGRVDAWRAKTDLELCNKQLEYDASKEEEQKLEDEDELSHDDEEFDGKTKKSGRTDKSDDGFKVYSISNLSSDQVAVFIRGKGVSNVPEFLQEIDRQDAWAYTTRPQDLIDIIDFWNKNKRIGSRLELVENSIERRLEERKENTAAANPISLSKVRDGVKLIAAASTLMKEATIRVPDGSENSVGIDAHSLLPDWTNEECNTLLSRPIFDDAIYGAVRFHHRSAKEYLTADWFNSSLEQGASRKIIESLFFKKIYGVEVLVPSMRPVLSWLVLFNDKIRKKACDIEPEVVFEGGDPSKLPVETRREILSKVCSKIEDDTSRRSVTDYSAVQRFSNPDMAENIKSLTVKYKNNAEITSFLMRMIWQGRIKQALPEAKIFSLDSNTEKYTRIAAIRAVKEIGSDADFKEILLALLSQETEIDRRILTETVDHLDESIEAVEWIFKALEKAKDKEKYSADGLSYSLVKFAERLEPDIAYKFALHVNRYLERTPVIERRFCEVSERYGWLINCGARAVEKLVILRHPYALSSESLSIISKIPPFNEYADFESRSLTTEITELAKDWIDLKFSLFWKDVEVTRENVFIKKDERLTYFWQAYTLGAYWNFEENDFDRVIKDITERDLLDDQLVALSLAFQIYKENERPRKWKEQLKKLAEGLNELEERLAELWQPSSQSKEQKNWKRQEAKWKRQDKKRKEERQKYHADWLGRLNDNFEKLKDKDLLENTFGEDRFLTAQHYLLERMRKLRDDSTHWTQGNWRDLIDEFGEEIASAFRDGLLLSWRFYKPKLRSEKDDENGTPIVVIIGLSGLEIEAREADNWPDGLSGDDVKLSCRYAFQELNGFPSWFSKLHQEFPKIVSDCVLTEIDWELTASQNGQEKHYIIGKVSRSGQTLWDDIAPELLKRLKTEPLSLKHLGYLLKIIQSSSTVSDQDIAQLAAKKCKALNDLNHIAQWFAAWVGVEPDTAIEELSKYLEVIQENTEAVSLAMNVIVNLVGERRTGSHTREGFKSAKHLKNLYLLMHKYIKIEEDINRAGKGAYSPQLRDDAQDARNGLLAILTEIPGEETYLALTEMAKTHPAENFRAWMMCSARERAEKDADLTAMSSNKFDDFQNLLKKNPKVLMLEPNIYGMGINLRAALRYLKGKLSSLKK